MRHALTLLIGIVAALSSRHAAVAAPAPAPAAGNKNASPTQPAVTALLREYQTAMKEKKGEGLRDKSDYFAENKPEGLTPEAVLAALEKSTSTDARADAYVKWQLLSGIEGKIADNLKPRLIKIYRAAPLPRPHPGLNKSQFDRLLSRVGIMNADKETPINKEVLGTIEAYRMDIEPMLAYRDELYAKLTPGLDTIQAGMADAYDRISRGAPANEFWATLSAAIKGWAVNTSDPGQLRAMAGAVTKLREAVVDERNRPYFKVTFTKSDNYTGLKWHAEGTVSNDKAMTETAEWLVEQAKNPGGTGGLKFKDPEPDPKGKK